MLKFRFGPPLKNVVPDEIGWRHFEIFSLLRMQYSLLTGFLLAVCLAVVWLAFLPESLPLGRVTGLEILYALLVLVLGHESLHLLGFPGAGLNGKAIAGIWMQGGSPYVQYSLPISRNRFLLVVIVPFVVISVLPFILAFNGNQLDPFWSWVSVANGFGAGSDIYIFIKLLRSVPRNAVVIESGERLYWKTQ